MRLVGNLYTQYHLCCIGKLLASETSDFWAKQGNAVLSGTSANLGNRYWLHLNLGNRKRQLDSEKERKNDRKHNKKTIVSSVQMAYWWKYNLNHSIYKNGRFIFHLNVHHGFFIFFLKFPQIFLANVIITHQLISSQVISKNYSKNRNWNSCLAIRKLNIVLLAKYFLWLMKWCSRFPFKNSLYVTPV